MKKILFFTNYPSPYRVEFFNRLGNVKCVELTVVFLEKPEDQKHRSLDWFDLSYRNFEAIFCKSPKIKFKKYGYRAEVLEWAKKDYDEIVFGGYSDLSFMVAMRYLRRKHKPYTMEVDGGIITQDSRMIGKIKKRFIGGASKYFSSGKNTDAYLKHYGADETRIFRYPFSSMTESELQNATEKAMGKSKARKKIGFSNREYVLFVGQFIKRKGIDILLRAISLLPRSIQFCLVGGTPSEEMIRFCEQNGITNVDFPGFVRKEEIADYYVGADVFVLPTRYDVWGLVINEAMAYGLPIVTTDKCVAGLELVENDVNGYIVAAEDAVALAEAIRKALVNHDSLGTESRKKIQQYSIENMVKKHMEADER